MNIKEIRKKIIEMFPKYEDKSLERALDDIEEIDGGLRLELEKFLETGVLPKLSIKGYSFDRLKKEFGMNPIAAFLTLDWLKKEPEEAKKSLEHGYDEVT